MGKTEEEAAEGKEGGPPVSPPAIEALAEGAESAATLLGLPGGKGESLGIIMAL
jgi:hypothetical protein